MEFLLPTSFLDATSAMPLPGQLSFAFFSESFFFFQYIAFGLLPLHTERNCHTMSLLQKTYAMYVNLFMYNRD